MDKRPLGKTRAHPKTTEQSATKVGYEVQLWQMADALRGSMDAAEYQHVVLVMIFLKFISGVFQEAQTRLAAERAKEPTRRARTNTAPRTFSGCRPKRAGRS